MVSGSNSILNAVQQRQLIALKNTARTIDDVQLRLATGKSVNSAIDNPQNYFSAQALNYRAGDLTRRLDDIRQSIRTLQEAQHGLDASLDIIDQAEAYLVDIEEKIKSGEIAVGLQDSNIVPDNVTQIRPNASGDFFAYAGVQDLIGTVNVNNNGENFTLNGNIWKKLLINYTVTADTVLEFDFRSTNQPEIAAIGFDNDNSIGNNSDRFFLYGTQFGGMPYAAPNATYQYDGSGDFVHVEIPIGAFFTGNFSHITFTNDHDAAPSDGQSEYQNVFLREGPIDNNAQISIGPEELQINYESILDQLDLIARDAHYRGVNLLEGEDLTTIFNEDRTSFLVTQGIRATSRGLGLQREDFNSLEAVQNKITQIKAAREELRKYVRTIASDINIIKTREIFTIGIINDLQAGRDDLINDDQNKTGAEFLALQTRQSLGITALSLGAQSAQSVLRLF